MLFLQYILHCDFMILVELKQRFYGVTIDHCKKSFEKLGARN